MNAHVFNKFNTRLLKLQSKMQLVPFWIGQEIADFILKEMITADEIKQLISDVTALVALVKDLESKAVPPVDPALADPALEQSAKDAHASAQGVVTPPPATPSPATP